MIHGPGTDLYALKFKKHWCHIAEWFPFVQHFCLLCAPLSFPRKSAVGGALVMALNSFTFKCSQSDNVLFNLCPMKIISSSIFTNSPTVSSRSTFTPFPEHSWSGLTTMQSCHSKIPYLSVLLPLTSSQHYCLSCWNHMNLCQYYVCHIFTAVHNNFTYYQSMYYASYSDF